MVRENRIKSAYVGFESPAEGALSTGLRATNTVEDDGSGQLVSSKAGPGMSEGGKATLRESENMLSNRREDGRLQTEEIEAVPSGNEALTSGRR